MNPERWARVESLFARAARLSEGQWSAFLVGEAGDDLEVIETVLKMLRNRDASKFIEPPSASAPAPEPPSGSAWIGRRLGDFELVERIDKGGMGLVFRARQLSLHRDVAVKILPFQSLALPHYLARFMKEPRAAARLHHPNIVPIYAVGEEGEVHWFAMELVDGPDLAKEIVRLAGKEPVAGGRLPPFQSREYLTTVVRLVEQAADALAFAHEHGVVHRDVKPHNLLVDSAGQMRVVDFGLARDAEQGSITSSSEQFGSPYYMSPEQVRHRMHAVDARTDVYSLGVVLYELLALRRPFEGATSSEVWYRIVHDEPPKLRRIAPRVPEDLATVCGMAMARELRDRYASAAEFRDDLGRFLRHEAVVAQRPSLARRALRFAKRHPVALGSALAAAVAVTAGVWFADARAQQRFEADEAKVVRALLDEPNWDEHVDVAVEGRRRWLRLRDQAATLSPELRDLESRLGERFERDFDERKLSLDAHLSHGFGGQRDPDRFGGHGAPSSPTELALFALEAERMRSIYGDLPETARVCDVTRSEPHVNLALDAATLAEVGDAKAFASLRKIDPLLGIRGPKQPIGELPIRDYPVPPGNWRFIVEIPDFGFAEYTRDLVPRATPLELAIRVRRSEAVAKGMKTIEKGRFKFDKKEERPMACDIDGPEADYESFMIDEAEVSNGDFVRFITETGWPAPKVWRDCDYRKDWRELPLEGIGERFLDLPVAGVSYADAQAFAEWAGKRLPTHLELERALRGSDRRIYPGGEAVLPVASGNYNVYGADLGQQISKRDRFALYLASAKPVRDPQFRQAPEGLFHAFGNVAEMTESLLAEPEDGVLAIKPWQRVQLGAAWDAAVNDENLQFHAINGVSERYRSMIFGLRCCRSSTP